jgi:hypothetical protein
MVPPFVFSPSSFSVLRASSAPLCFIEFFFFKQSGGGRLDEERSGEAEGMAPSESVGGSHIRTRAIPLAGATVGRQFIGQGTA